MPVSFNVSSIRAGSLITLELQTGELAPANLELRIKGAFRRQAKKHHPDLGGSSETSRKIQEACETLSNRARHPTYVRRRGVPDKWLYQDAHNRWIKPIVQRRTLYLNANAMGAAPVGAVAVMALRMASVNRRTANRQTLNTWPEFAEKSGGLDLLLTILRFVSNKFY